MTWIKSPGMFGFNPVISWIMRGSRLTGCYSSQSREITAVIMRERPGVTNK